MKPEVKEKDLKRKARKPNGGRGRTRKPGMTRISAKNQVTLPVGVLRAGAFAVGDELEVEIDDQGRIVISKAKPARSVVMELA
ncbi:MAG: AbrB/MazE/SpoVT family DNA-binding domain-containing protein, partial [Thermoleophilaceae bacterium]|nr:AbrB/MazE/SpoVT family DNA-binding domain-containing protein [Thermoleophilaceae bacterium]